MKNRYIKLIVLILVMSLLSACGNTSDTTPGQSFNDNSSVSSKPSDDRNVFKEPTVADKKSILKEVIMESEGDDFPEELIDDFLDRLEKGGFFVMNEKDAEDLLRRENMISMVRYAESGSYEGITYRDAFDGFFSYPTWNYFEGKRDNSDEIVKVIEFTGGCLYKEQETSALIQFELNEEEGTFKATYLSFDGVSQDMNTLSALIEKAFSGAQLDANKVKPVH